MREENPNLPYVVRFLTHLPICSLSSLALAEIDMLERKLRSGISVSKYFPEYEGANDFEEVWRWFRSRFRKIVTSSRSVAPQRPVYVHTTVATVSFDWSEKELRWKEKRLRLGGK